MDLHGRVTDTWILSQHGIVAGMNPDRNLLAMVSRDSHKMLIIGYPSRKVVQTRINSTGIDRNVVPELTIPKILFTESGKTLCSVVSGVLERGAEAQCTDVDTDAMIAEFPRFPGGLPAVGSAHGSRLVLTQVSRFPRVGDYAYGDRVVWDFRSGAEVAEWKTIGQILEVANPTSAIVQLAPIAISATGRYVAEGSNRVLRIYEVQ
jgi:hypothetical protein